MSWGDCDWSWKPCRMGISRAVLQMQQHVTVNAVTGSYERSELNFTKTFKKSDFLGSKNFFHLIKKKIHGTKVFNVQQITILCNIFQVSKMFAMICQILLFSLSSGPKSQLHNLADWRIAWWTMALLQDPAGKANVYHLFDGKIKATLVKVWAVRKRHYNFYFCVSVLLLHSVWKLVQKCLILYPSERSEQKHKV